MSKTLTRAVAAPLQRSFFLGDALGSSSRLLFDRRISTLLEDPENVVDVSKFDPLNKLEKQVGRLSGMVARKRNTNDIYLIKGLQEGIPTRSESEVRCEFLMSSFMENYFYPSPFCKQIVAPKTCMVAMKDQTYPSALASRIIPLDQYPTAENIQSYARRTARILEQYHFLPFMDCIMPLAIIGSNDHPGPGFGNVGFERRHGKLVVMDFDVGMGSPKYSSSLRRDFSKDTFVDYLDEMRGIRMGILGMDAIESIKFSRKDWAIPSPMVTMSICSRYLTFDTILRFKPIDSRMISKISGDAFSDYDFRESKSSVDLEDKKISDSKDEDEKKSSDRPAKLRVAKDEIIEVLTERSKDAEDLHKIATFMITGLNPHQIFPSAAELMEFGRNFKSFEEILDIPAKDRQEIINRMVKDAGLECYQDEYKEKTDKNPIRPFDAREFKHGGRS